MQQGVAVVVLQGQVGAVTGQRLDHLQQRVNVVLQRTGDVLETLDNAAITRAKTLVIAVWIVRISRLYKRCIGTTSY